MTHIGYGVCRARRVSDPCPFARASILQNSFRPLTIARKPRPWIPSPSTWDRRGGCLALALAPVRGSKGCVGELRWLVWSSYGFGKIGVLCRLARQKGLQLLWG